MTSAHKLAEALRPFAEAFDRIEGVISDNTRFVLHGTARHGFAEITGADLRRAREALRLSEAPEAGWLRKAEEIARSVMDGFADEFTHEPPVKKTFSERLVEGIAAALAAELVRARDECELVALRKRDQRPQAGDIGWIVADHIAKAIHALSSSPEDADATSK